MENVFFELSWKCNFLPSMESGMSRLNSHESATAGCRYFVMRNQFALDDGAVGG
jgi:hypothetical protein